MGQINNDSKLDNSIKNLEKDKKLDIKTSKTDQKTKEIKKIEAKNSRIVKNHNDNSDSNNKIDSSNVNKIVNNDIKKDDLILKNDAKQKIDENKYQENKNKNSEI